MFLKQFSTFRVNYLLQTIHMKLPMLKKIKENSASMQALLTGFVIPVWCTHKVISFFFISGKLYEADLFGVLLMQ